MVAADRTDKLELRLDPSDKHNALPCVRICSSRSQTQEQQDHGGPAYGAVMASVRIFNRQSL